MGPPQFLDKDLKPIKPSGAVPPKYLDKNLQPIEVQPQAKPEGFSIEGALTAYPGIRAAKSLVVDPIVEGIKAVRDRGEISPLTTTLGGLFGPGGSFVGSLAGQTAENMVSGNTNSPLRMAGNAALDATVDYGLGKFASRTGQFLGTAQALKQEGSSNPIREMLLKKFFPERGPEENINAARTFADKIPTSVGQATGNPRALMFERGSVGAKALKLAEQQEAGITKEFTKFDKRFLDGRTPSQQSLGREAQKIVARNTEIPIEELGDPSKFFEKSFANIDEAKRLKRQLTLVSQDEGKVAAAAYYEHLMEKATDKAKRTFNPNSVINDLLDNDSPAKVFLHSKQRESLIQFNRQLQNIGTSKAALGWWHDGEIAIAAATSLLTGGGKLSFGKTYGLLEGAKLLVTAPLSRALMDPKNAKLAIRLTKVKPDSPEAKFASKALLLAMKGQQVKFQIPNIGVFPASVNEQGKVEIKWDQTQE